MGRGLSDLQRTILRVALANRERERRDLADLGFEPPPGFGHELCDVFRAEVLAEHFGFPLPSGYYREREGVHRRSNWGHNFSVRGIGAGRYRSAQASLARALRRLEERGLGVRGWWGGGSGI